MTAIASYPAQRVSPLRFLLSMQRDPLQFLVDLAQTGEDLIPVQVGPRQIVLLRHPTLIREVLVVQHRHFTKGLVLQRARRLLGNGLLTAEGEVHLRQRRLIQPAFHRERVAGYGATMAATAARHCQAWQPGQQLDMAEEMAALTLSIVGETLFGADVAQRAAEVGESLSALMQLFGLLMSPWGEFILRLPIPAAQRARRAEVQLDRLITEMIQERRADDQRLDLLALLLAARDTEGDGVGMDDRQVRDEALTLFLAGHETTANALTWSWYLLSQHPEVAQQLHQEVDQVCADRLPGVEDVARLPYTRAVFAEAMRLYPPAWILGRQATQDVSIGGTPVAAGTTILISQWLLHRDPRFYHDPLHFHPHRWLDSAAADGRAMTGGDGHNQALTYMPFGLGPRKCIGEGFAWMEGVLLLATIARRWSLQLAPGQRIGLNPAVTLRPKYGMRMQVLSR